MNISGKRAVVFGGTSGIGLATTQMLAAGGAMVTAISRNPSKAGPLPANVMTQSCDVLDGAAVEALLNNLGPMDILVSAATVAGVQSVRFSKWTWTASRVPSTNFGVTPTSSDMAPDM